MKRILAALCILMASTGCKPLVLAGDPDAAVFDARPTSADGGHGTPDAARQGSLTVRGRVCTEPTIDHVKIQFLLDASGSMCITDGPGAPGTAGFCDAVAAALKAKGVTIPGRVRALKTLMQHLALQEGVSVAIVPFDTSTKNAYPASGFVPASDPQLTPRLDGLANALGSGTDYQGALAAARKRIEDDVLGALTSGRQAELAHTRYVTVFLSDGFPYPRCSAQDQLGAWASAEDPSGTWQDHPASFCNTPAPPPAGDAGENPECLGTDCPGPDAGDNPECLGSGCGADAGVVYSDVLPDFPIGGDRNQNAQLFAEVRAMMELEQQRGVGEVRLDTVLLFNDAAKSLCGDLCFDEVFSLPGGKPNDARIVARWTLKQLALRGHGSFHEYVDPNLLSFSWIDTSMVGKETAVQGVGPLVHRYAGERTPEVYAGFPGPERPIDPDGDGDGFSDAFESAHTAEGFNPAVPDARGCKSVPGTPAASVCDDADGDGLSEPMELYLGSNPYLEDSDADGLPDGIEVAEGLDPAEANGGFDDSDGDGPPDVKEVLLGTDPLVRDETNPYVSYSHSVGFEYLPDGRVCATFEFGKVRLDYSAPSGRGYFTVSFGQVPKGSVNQPGTWRQACAFGVAPRPWQAPEIVFEDADFVPMWRFGAEVGQVLPKDYATLCKNAQ